MLDHCFSPSVLGPTRIAGCIFERNRAGINRQRDPNRLTLADQKWFTTQGCIFEVTPCATLPPPMASQPALEFPVDSAPMPANPAIAQGWRRWPMTCGSASSVEGGEARTMALRDCGVAALAMRASRRKSASSRPRATPTRRNAPGHSRLPCADCVNLPAMPGVRVLTAFSRKGVDGRDV
jgi:hypothetical protein